MVFFVLVGALVGAIIYLVQATIYWLGGEALEAGLSSDLTPVSLTIGTEVLSVPRNIIRFSDQRRPGHHKRLDLIARWPGFSGYSRDQASVFNDVSPDAPLLFLSLQPRTSSVDSTQRFIGLYSRFFNGAGEPGPAGLVRHRLEKGTGYDSEEIFFQPGSTKPFVARCMVVTDPTLPTTCLREVHVGRNLALLYRFRQPLLADWQSLDPAVRAFVDRLRATP